jgi:prepilin-type processing-associated H-X9-DG protein
MDWQDHTWSRNPFNRPPIQTSGWISMPDQLTCPNPTGSTAVQGQTWGAQGAFNIFACPSQPFNHQVVDRGNLILNVLQGLPTIDMPRGNPFWDGVAHPECMDSSSTLGQGCTYTIGSFPPGNLILGRSDYVAVVGAFIDNTFTEPPLTPGLAAKYRSLFNYHANARLANVPDGTSNTLLLSEYAGQIIRDDATPQLSGWRACSWACNGLSVVFGTCPNPNNDAKLPGGQCDFSAADSTLGGGATIGGWHGQMFNVAFADGSVRPLRLDIDKSLLLSLAGSADGDVVSVDY